MNEEQLAPLIAQIKMLTDAVKISLERLDQAFRLHKEQTDQLSKLIDSLLVVDEALKKSLSETDQQIDDLAVITAYYQEQVAAMSEQNGQQDQ